MKHSIVGCLASFLILVGGTAYAATWDAEAILNETDSEVVVTIKGTSDIYSPVSIRTYTSNGDLYYFNQVNSNDKGEFETSYTMNKESTGDESDIYTVVLNSYAYSDNIEKKYTFINTEDNTELLKKINRLKDSSAKAEEINAILNDKVYGRLIDIDKDLYSALSNKKAIADAVADKEYKLVTDFSNEFKQATSIQSINEATSNNIVERIGAADIGFDLTEKGLYSSLSDKAFVTNGIISAAPYSLTDKEAIVNKFIALSNIVAINEVTTENRDKVEEYIAAINSVHPLTSSSYSYLKNASTSVKNSIIIELLKKRRFSNETALDSALYSVVESSKANNGSGGSGGAGDSGGSGGSSSSTGVKLPANQNATINKMYEEENVFTDVALDHWARRFIRALKDEGIVNGDENGHFRPNDNITREEFLKMLIEAINVPLVNEGKKFDDVESGSWYAPYVYTGAGADIISGISDTEFGVGANITREQMAKMAYAALGTKTEISDNIFVDDDEINDWAEESVYALNSLGIISGYDDNTFRPNNYATRAEAAKIIYSIFEERNKS